MFYISVARYEDGNGRLGMHFALAIFIPDPSSLCTLLWLSTASELALGLLLT